MPTFNESVTNYYAQKQSYIDLVKQAQENSTSANTEPSNPSDTTPTAGLSFGRQSLCESDRKFLEQLKAQELGLQKLDIRDGKKGGGDPGMITTEKWIQEMRQKAENGNNEELKKRFERIDMLMGVAKKNK